MQYSIVARNMVMLILGILIAALTIFFASNYFMHEGFERHIKKDMETMRNVVDDDLANLKDRLFQEVLMLAQANELINAFRSKDHLLLASVAKSAKERFRASFATIVDAQGTVLARGYWDKRGDNIANSQVVLDALKGNANVDVVKLKNNGLSVGAAAPVYIDGQLVGAILFGEAFRTNSFVDEIKRTTGLEMTVFDTDVRISTTIMREGERAVGTYLENDNVRADVLREGNIYSANADILGKAYKTVYWPLRNTQGTILGMWFIGTEVEGIEEMITTIALSCLAATLVIAVALSCLGGIIFRSTVNPLEKKAYVDMLTGITNRAGFEKQFNLALSERPHSGAMFLIDLDNFKDINDNLGHPVGDECLKRVAYLLREVFRKDDIVARLGGDEFIVFASNMGSVESIKEKAQEFINIITYTYKLANNVKLTLTASIGISLYPKDGKTYTPLYNNADAALYTAKNRGRNQLIFFSKASEGRNFAEEAACNEQSSVK